MKKNSYLWPQYSPWANYRKST